MSCAFETITDVQDGSEVALKRPIDNREGNLGVALRSLTYTVGWYNLHGPPAWFSWTPDGVGTGILNFAPGLYTAQGLIDLILATEAGTVYNLEMSVSETTGLLTFRSVGMEISASDSIWTLLGLDLGLGGAWLSGTQTGNRPVNFSGVEQIRVHLRQLSSNGNSVDGAPSTLLDSIVPGPHRFGDIVEEFRPLPLWKRLQGGSLQALQLELLDSNGNEINNHGLRVTAVLEIRPM